MKKLQEIKNCEIQPKVAITFSYFVVEIGFNTNFMLATYYYLLFIIFSTLRF